MYFKNIAGDSDEKQKTSGTTRIHVSYPNSIKGKLKEMTETSGHVTISEVFREALKLYVLAHDEHKKGSDLLIRDKDGNIERLRLFL